MTGPSDKTDKSEKADKKAKPGGALLTGATDLRSRVPAMADDALATLLANAKRMLETGNVPQKTMAGDLVPVIENEIAERKAKKAAASPRKAAAARKAKAAKADGGA